MTTVMNAAQNSTPAGLPREVYKWLQSLDLSYSVKNIRRAFNNGFLVAEIFSRYFPGDVQMHSFANTENYKEKLENWTMLRTFFTRRKIPIVINHIDALILNEHDTMLEFVRQIYTLLTERQLLPPIKLYEQTQQNDQIMSKGQDMLNMEEDMELTRENEEAQKKEMSMMNQSQASPQKSLAIQGPPKIISEKLEIDNYQGVKVTDISVRPLNQNIAQIRAQKETNESHHSQSYRNHQNSGADGNTHHSNSHYQRDTTQGGHNNYAEHNAASRVYSAVDSHQEAPIPHKTIVDILQQKITEFVSREGNANEFAQIKVENDMVFAFFSGVHQLSDHFAFNFIEELKLDIENIVVTLYKSANELAAFYTFLLMLLRNASTNDSSFTNTLIFCKSLAAKLNEDIESPSQEFNKFFSKHLFKNMCAIIRECPTKRQYMCELIYVHCAHDLQMRINIVKSLKNYLRDDELVYQCQAYLIQQEEDFNEQWFDVFLYYALIGLSNPRTNIRVTSINILNSIAKHNAEGILDVTQKILNIADEPYWEIKAQCLEFAATLLTCFQSQSHLLAQKEGIKSTIQKQQANPNGNSKTQQQDFNAVKQNLIVAIDIIKKCFNTHVPKSVQKLGLFKLQPLLQDYQLLYPAYVDVLIQIDYEIKTIILKEDPIRTGEEIYFSLGIQSFNYKLKSDINNFDNILLANTLIDLVIANEQESLEREQMEIFMISVGKRGVLEDTSSMDSWLKVFQKLKEYLLVSICDPQLIENALVIIHNFLTADQLKFQVYEETRDIFINSLELLYQGEQEQCKEMFRDYLLNQVVTRTEDTDNALKKFFKSILIRLSEDHSAVYGSSNITDIIEQLN